MTVLSPSPGAAWCASRRAPTLGILGVAAVGALLFDMLLLSQGLIVSMRDLLDRTGYDVRVTTTRNCRGRRRALERRGGRRRAAIRQLPCDGPTRRLGRPAAPMRTIERAGRRDRVTGDVPRSCTGTGAPTVDGASRAATCQARRRVVVNDTSPTRSARRARRRRSPSAPRAESSCDALPPVRLRVAGVAAFPFELTAEQRSAGSIEHARLRSCGGDGRRPGRPDPRGVGRRSRRRGRAIQRAAAGPRAATNATDARPAPAGRLHLLPSDLDGADDGHRVVCAAAHHRAADGVGQPAARRNRRACARSASRAGASSPTCSANRR